MSREIPVLAGIVVHWRNQALLDKLVAAWPEDRDYELIVVDNCGTAKPTPPWVRRIEPGRNLGFGSGANRGVAATQAPYVLILNPDAAPGRGALAAIVAAFEEFEDAFGIVPALFGPDGTAQHGWQLRPLPKAHQLLRQTLFLPGVSGPVEPPRRGARIEQPAAAALALRRETLLALGGLDEGFHPAWFEDVDLARRAAAIGRSFRYEPGARFVHSLGASVPVLGYGPFLWIYYRNLERYLCLHHGTAWQLASRASLLFGVLLRLVLLPVRRPRRAASRLAAAAGLLGLALGASSGWRLPKSYRASFARQAEAA